MSERDEFFRTRRPGTKRSRLYPHLQDVLWARREGFSYGQICEYLKTKGVTITISGLASYLKRQEGRGADVVARTSQSTLASDPDPAPNEAGLDIRQRRERRADQFINPQTTNQLLKRMKERSE